MFGELTLRQGAKIAVIGGGPAGSFFAHFAEKWASRMGIDVSVTIFDGKDFLQRGPRGCNLCAGVIARSLYQKLMEENILLPEGRIVNRVDGYCLHVHGDKLLLTCAERGKEPIPTVFRGNGPRYATFPDVISFDDFLLTWAQDKGAKVISQPVWGIQLPEDISNPVRIFYGQRSSTQSFEADLVVGAFGVNAFLMKKIQDLGFGYRAPSTLATYQAEFKLGKQDIMKHFGNYIHVYMPKSKLIRYATITPKEDYITVTLIGKGHVTRNVLSEFLRLEEVRGKIPFQKPQCFCFPRIAVSPSHNPYTHRLILIGDASFSRHYKNGLESAFLTAKLAAEAAFRGGITASSFNTYYYRPAKKLIIRDNTYGRMLFRVNDMISSVPLLSLAHLSLAKQGNERISAGKIKFILWNMFTGDIPYRRIFLRVVDIRLQFALFVKTVNLLFKKIKRIITRTENRDFHGGTNERAER